MMRRITAPAMIPASAFFERPPPLPLSGVDDAASLGSLVGTNFATALGSRDVGSAVGGVGVSAVVAVCVVVMVFASSFVVVIVSVMVNVEGVVT